MMITVVDETIGCATDVCKTTGSESVGHVRLDVVTAAASVGRVDCGAGSRSDITTVTHALEHGGPSRLSALIGDFALLWSDQRQHRLVAARDAFGARPLYYRQLGTGVLVASRAHLLTDTFLPSRAFMADFLVMGCGHAPRCVHQHVTAIEPGQGITWEASGERRHFQLWHTPALPEYARLNLQDAGTEFRRLLFEAVRVRSQTSLETWAQLSGGLDSSSIVVAAQGVHRNESHGSGIGGLVSFTDDLGNSDERIYQDAVAAIVSTPRYDWHGCWYWQNDGEPPPLTDQPTLTYPMYARDRHVARFVRGAGGRVLLSGHGGDHLLSGNRTYLADYLVRGRLRTLVRDVAALTIEKKRSFWSECWRSAIRPLLPASLRSRLGHEWRRSISLLCPSFVEEFELTCGGSVQRESGPAGAKWHAERLYSLRQAAEGVHRDLYDDQLEIRYPFLHRPLVEFLLTLPPDLIAGPRDQKLVLREGMQGWLPEVVRTRRDKGGFGTRLRWGLEHERVTIDHLLTDPIVVRLGCIDLPALRRTVTRVRDGRSQMKGPLLAVLSLETWLRVQSGEWVRPTTSAAAAPMPVSRHASSMAAV